MEQEEEEDDGTTHSEDSFETVDETQLEPLPEENDPSFRQEDAKYLRKKKYVRKDKYDLLWFLPPEMMEEETEEEEMEESSVRTRFGA